MASPANADESDSAEAQALIQEPLSLYAVRDMDFGQIAAVTAGTVVMTPDYSASCTPSAGLIHLGACKSAVFSGYGLPLALIEVQRPPGGAISLAEPGGERMLVSNLAFASDASLVHLLTTPTTIRYLIVSPSGLFEFRVGGTANVALGQAAGTYAGNLVVTVSYN